MRITKITKNKPLAAAGFALLLCISPILAGCSSSPSSTGQSQVKEVKDNGAKGASESKTDNKQTKEKEEAKAEKFKIGSFTIDLPTDVKKTPLSEVEKESVLKQLPAGTVANLYVLSNDMAAMALEIPIQDISQVNFENARKGALQNLKASQNPDMAEIENVQPFNKNGMQGEIYSIKFKKSGISGVCHSVTVVGKGDNGLTFATLTITATDNEPQKTLRVKAIDSVTYGGVKLK